MIDPRQPPHHRLQPPGRQRQRIAAGEDHLPDLGPLGDIGEGGVQGGGIERLGRARSDHLAAEAEPAVGGADVGQFQQHPVGIAVHHPLHRAVASVADGIGVLARRDVQLGRLGQELAGDGVCGIGGVDQVEQGRGHRHGVMRRHPLQRRQPFGVDQAGRRQGLRAAQGPAHAPASATGLQITCSICRAPLASITSRSKPRAAPEASGIASRAARNASSIG